MSAFRLGLTGSIGMGKSTTAGFFLGAGVPVWDADACVHRIYAAGGPASGPIGTVWPQAIRDAAVDRGTLKTIIADDLAALRQIESIVHPLVANDRAAFLADARADIVLLDIPLLFETGAEAGLDATLLVTAPASLQRARVMARAGMTEALFADLLGRQMPDAEKRARATHIIETLSLPSAKACVLALIDHIRSLRYA